MDEATEVDDGDKLVINQRVYDLAREAGADMTRFVVPELTEDPLLDAIRRTNRRQRRSG